MAHLEETALAEEEVDLQGGGAAAEGLNLPPPKPPYSFTKVAVGWATTSGAGKAAVLHRGSGAEVGTVAKEEGEDTVHDGGGWIQSGEDSVASGSTGVLRGGVVATRGAPNSHVEAALSSDGDPCRGWFCRFFDCGQATTTDGSGLPLGARR